jgi:hypothetical protein
MHVVGGVSSVRHKTHDSILRQVGGELLDSTVVMAESAPSTAMYPVCDPLPSGGQYSKPLRWDGRGPPVPPPLQGYALTFWGSGPGGAIARKKQQEFLFEIYMTGMIKKRHQLLTGSSLLTWMTSKRVDRQEMRERYGNRHIRERDTETQIQVRVHGRPLEELKRHSSRHIRPTYCLVSGTNHSPTHGRRVNSFVLRSRKTQVRSRSQGSKGRGTRYLDLLGVPVTRGT